MNSLKRKPPGRADVPLCELWRDPSGFVHTQRSCTSAEKYNDLRRLFPAAELPEWRDIPVVYANQNCIIKV